MAHRIIVHENRPSTSNAIASAALAATGEIGQAPEVWIPSKQGLDDAHDEFLRRENGEQERQERSRSGGGQTGDVVKPEGYETHLAYQGITIAKISERQDIGSAEEFVGRDSIAEDPFLFKALDVALTDKSVVGQPLPFCASHLGSKHREWTENGQDEKKYKATYL